MTRTVRNIVLATALVAATGTAFAARQGAEPVVRNPLAISMLADSSSAQAFMGQVDFKITNNSRDVLKVPYWQLPGASEESKLFQVYRDGKVATYLGPMIKRLAPTESDYVVFQPYETKVFSVDLSKSYDMSETGEYTVSFASMLQGAKTGKGQKVADRNGRMASLKSPTLKLWVDADNALKALKGDMKAQGKPGSGGTVSGGVTYVGCSSTQISGAGAGVTQARAYTENAKGYLNGNNQGPRYTTWMGAYTSTRYNTVTGNFVKIDTAMDQSGGQIKINCGCNQNYYAYVYPTKPYEIFVCKAFWTAGTSGTDSKAGTLIHEMSHFNIVAATDDIVYGQAGAKSLAISSPDQAIQNADSHEYFAENTPNQN
ncbi:MAG: M35 family metallo-endopeptidase [Gammaproteobacteria bacterium]|nr:M35 family metallo-endopeptidase [Gammaproteobacteria bacterium]